MAVFAAGIQFCDGTDRKGYAGFPLAINMAPNDRRWLDVYLWKLAGAALPAALLRRLRASKIRAAYWSGV